MSFALETTENVGGSGSDKYLDMPGTYHCLIMDVKENQGPKGNFINGFTVELSVLAGTTEGQRDKTTSLCLFSPDLSKSESSQEWSRKKQTAFVIAAGILDLAKLGGKVNVELSSAIGRQIIIQFEKGDDDKYLQLHYANIYHVDDPRAAKFIKDLDAINIIKKEHRKPAEYFEPLMKKSAEKQPAPVLSRDELNDL